MHSSGLSLSSLTYEAAQCYSKLASNT
ncbi:hypothetical protein MPC4_260060 [Methylocella tundrae]|uniref:Uncharacterized protein n=1 Tax=Methylocella tundrae TaxID=227605 RepID=A0A8B6M6E5_METTU|nr:hypothetical protein MPC1_13400002 [Methylocella tundrae]VTZ50623.1 hypothetical protein MPC4_260060 [Methylocella tundrae]